MKKIKSYIIASILGLLNIVPGNTDATFVENENFPYFYNQADHLTDGIHWFQSKTDPSTVFYVLPREIDRVDEKKWKFVCGENNKFLKQLQKHHFICMELDDELKLISPRFYEDNQKNFYQYLYKTYQDANNKTGKLPKNLLFDNPLDNLGWFYNGLGKGDDLLDRVRNSTRSDKNIKKVNMFAINTGNPNQKAFEVPKDFNPDITKLHPWIQNVYEFLSHNVYLQHGEINELKARKDLDCSAITEQEYNKIVSNSSPTLIDSYSNTKKIKKPYYGNTKEIDMPLQNQKHVFFSPVLPGFEYKNQYSLCYLKFKLINNLDFFDLPLISISEDMETNASKNCYIGLPEDVFSMLVNEISFDRDENDFSVQTAYSLDKLVNVFTAYEVRIPEFIFADKFQQRAKYWQKKTDKMKSFEKEYREKFKCNVKKGKSFNVIDPSSSDIFFPKY